MNLAVFLPNWIGDAVMATPALRALRQLPGRHIIGVARSYVAGVLEGGDWFDDLVTLKRGTLHTMNAAWQLRRHKIDTALLLPNSFRSAATAWLAGARRIVGYARHGRTALLSDPVPILRDDRGRPRVRPVLLAYNRLAEHLGCPDPGHRLHLYTTETDEAAAQSVWRLGGFQGNNEVICFNSGGAFGAAKHWPVEYFARLAQLLFRQRGGAILVLCGPSERTLANAIAQQARQLGAAATFSLGELEERGGPPLSLGLSKACVRRADLLVTTDSGPRHFAHAFDRPVVTLFGPTHIGWTETYHARAIHLQRQLDCGPCQRRTCPLGHHRCMQELMPDEVLSAVQSLLTPRIALARAE